MTRHILGLPHSRMHIAPAEGKDSNYTGELRRYYPYSLTNSEYKFSTKDNAYLLHGKYNPKEQPPERFN